MKNDSFIKLTPLALGTAQLGLDYGIANKQGKPTLERAFSILDEAYNHKVVYLDTAQAYGESEVIIGKYLFKTKKNFKVISKIAPQIDITDKKKVDEAIDSSLNKIGSSLEALLLHNPQHVLNWNKNIEECFYRAKGENKTKFVGSSIYTEAELEFALKIEAIDFIQVPFNVFDCSLIKSQLIEKSIEMGKTIFIRSIYLQGLLTLDFEEATLKLPVAASFLRKWFDLCNEYDISPKILATHYVKNKFEKAILITACEDELQLKENFKIYHYKMRKVDWSKLERLFSNVPENIKNPSLWKRL